MAALVGTKVASSLLGRSDAEKAFRPWWDNFEDQLIYGLICLGLIVFPTAMINGTPLLCTYCKEGLCGDKDGKAEDDPGHQHGGLSNIAPLILKRLTNSSYISLTFCLLLP